MYYLLFCSQLSEEVFAGLVGGTIFKHIRMKNGTYEKASEAAEEMAEAELEPGM